MLWNGKADQKKKKGYPLSSCIMQMKNNNLALNLMKIKKSFLPSITLIWIDFQKHYEKINFRSR
jgi:hypothetical protein